MSKIATTTLAAMMLSGMFVVGCETSHTEKDKTTILGAQKHEETTTTNNPITGDTSTGA